MARKTSEDLQIEIDKLKKKQKELAAKEKAQKKAAEEKRLIKIAKAIEAKTGKIENDIQLNEIIAKL